MTTQTQSPTLRHKVRVRVSIALYNDCPTLQTEAPDSIVAEIGRTVETTRAQNKDSTIGPIYHL